MTESHWRLQSRAVIRDVHSRLSDDISLKDRQKAIDEAYPFGPRQYHPYKMWLIERRAYLSKYGYQARSAKHETPLERMMRRAGEK